MRSRIAWTILPLAILVAVIALMGFNLTAPQEPGHVETYTANLAKRLFVRGASRRGIPPRPLDIKASLDNGATHYGLDYSICHGTDGRAQATLG